MNGTVINNMKYADDNMMIAETEEQLQVFIIQTRVQEWV